jgi:hypothetical protein
MTRFLKLVEKYDKAIVAISTALIALFTVILAFATGFLWHATRDLVRGAEDTAARQLRAYVFVTASEITNFKASEAIQCVVVIKNTGLTPAYKMTAWVSIVASTFPRTEFPPTDLIPAKTFLGPGGDYRYIVQTGTAMSPEARTMIANGSAAIYVYGEIHYTDAFKIDRFTKFRGIFRGSGLSPVAGATLPVTQTQEGNEAN